MSELQQGQSVTTPMTAVQATEPSIYPNAEAVGRRWDEPISAERTRLLDERMATWKAEADHGDRVGPFANTRLFSTDVFYLAACVLVGASIVGVTIDDLDAAQTALRSARKDRLYRFLDLSALHLEGASLREAHLEGAFLFRAHLEGASLHGAHLEGVFLTEAHLEGADLTVAHLEGASLHGAHLEGTNLNDAYLGSADLDEAYLEGADLTDAHLEGAGLTEAHLEGANLNDAHLEDAGLREAHLEGANLFRSHLEGAFLIQAHLEGKTYRHEDPDYARVRRWVNNFPTVLSAADITQATLNKVTHLNGISLSGVCLDQVTFDNANLTVVSWDGVAPLGDESRALAPRDRYGQTKDPVKRLAEFEAAVRANRVLAVTLRNQGLSEDADIFAYRAQVLQRRVLRRRRRYASAFGAWLLDSISGYGYRPIRSLIAYVIVILGFAGVYFSLGATNGQVLSWNEAIVISMTAFHGRGFFQTAFQPGDVQAAVAAVEAFIGLLIEIVLIATFTQRFFSR